MRDVPDSQLSVFYSTMNRACCGLRDALKTFIHTTGEKKKRREGINVYKNLFYNGVSLHVMILNGTFEKEFGQMTYVE